MMRRIGPTLTAALALVLFLAAALTLHHQLSAYRFHDIEASLAGISRGRVFLAIAFTLLSYLALTLYDLMALRYVGKALGYARTAFASFIAYVFSHNVGISVLGGSAVRFRLYSAFGLSSLEIAKIVGFCALTTWLGFCTLGGAVLLLAPPPAPDGLQLPIASARALGAILLAFAAGYVFLSIARKAPLRLRGFLLELPPPRIALAQLAVSSLDWALTAAVFAVLLPPGTTVGYPRIVGVLLLAHVAGMLSHVPAGLGVFETIVVAFLGADVGAPAVLAAIVAYRLVYYLLPLGIATALLGSFEALERREKMRRALATWASWSARIAPSLLALSSFVGGAILLLSGATPEEPSRLVWLDRFLPLGVVELSHFAGSLAGVGLVLLARGLQRRLDAAYVLAVALLYAGIVASLLKGLDYEEALTLTVVLLAFLPSKRLFYRKASLFSGRFTPAWTAAIVIMLASMLWLGFFAHRHVEYSADLWWRFALEEDAPRFLRATVGVMAVALFFALRALLRPASPVRSLPGNREMEKVGPIVEHSRKSSAHLALLGDKSLLFSDHENAFLMYAVEGRSWIAMGDPVGPDEEQSELAWAFRELSDRHGGWPVFYEVDAANIPLYLDLGLSLVKLGEEGRVSLQSFSLEGSERKSLRNLQHKIERTGSRFEWVPAEGVEELLPALRAVSDAWLREKATREKGFSLGFFDEDYLKRTPLGLVRQGGKVVAFANVWEGSDREEVSVDLMRHSPDAPAGTMDYLFLSLMQWGRDEGYQWFNFGMAPLSGLEARPLAPLWNRVGSAVFHHGERFYNFQGLRQYKEKFDPVWEPKYLAAPSGLILPRVLTNLATLVSRGYRGVVFK